MLVVIDVGNTNITLGVYDQDELIANFRLTTKLQRTSDLELRYFHSFKQRILIQRGLRMF